MNDLFKIDLYLNHDPLATFSGDHTFPDICKFCRETSRLILGAGMIVSMDSKTTTVKKTIFVYSSSISPRDIIFNTITPYLIGVIGFVVIVTDY